nr:MAG TPA: hypothetical protein [Caudoviricetes sp.]
MRAVFEHLQSYFIIAMIFACYIAHGLPLISVVSFMLYVD